MGQILETPEGSPLLLLGIHCNEFVSYSRAKHCELYSRLFNEEIQERVKDELKEIRDLFSREINKCYHDSQDRVVLWLGKLYSPRYQESDQTKPKINLLTSLFYEVVCPVTPMEPPEVGEPEQKPSSSTAETESPKSRD